ncbi:unnamed protein product [Vicia faba]|uniref:Uncharacterized protein n=1 Tax=Vicia faba TaxID=3906 RepID=A0AAV0ZNY9_VICFA|nr:unnamed protein product [Vicia faba]
MPLSCLHFSSTAQQLDEKEGRCGIENIAEATTDHVHQEEVIIPKSPHDYAPPVQHPIPATAKSCKREEENNTGYIDFKQMALVQFACQKEVAKPLPI